jgi:hypothetical protein
MHKNATKCNKTLSKWCNNKHGASKIIDTFETYQEAISGNVVIFGEVLLCSSAREEANTHARAFPINLIVSLSLSHSFEFLNKISLESFIYITKCFHPCISVSRDLKIYPMLIGSMNFLYFQNQYVCTLVFGVLALTFYYICTLVFSAEEFPYFASRA